MVGVRPPPQTDAGWWSACTSSSFCKQWTPAPPLCNLKYRKMRAGLKVIWRTSLSWTKERIEPGKILLNWVMCSAQGVGLFYLSEISQAQGHSYGVMQGSKDHMHKGDRHLFPIFSLLTYTIHIYVNIYISYIVTYIHIQCSCFRVL